VDFDLQREDNIRDLTLYAESKLGAYKFLQRDSRTNIAKKLVEGCAGYFGDLVDILNELRKKGVYENAEKFVNQIDYDLMIKSFILKIE
ncbi:hypothetical protein HDU99_010086, partial [Rhizoclosmatium hyalinum]